MKRILKVSGRGIVNILLFLIFFIPFYWMALTSVKTLGQTLQSPPIFWVKNPQFQNFVTAFKSIHFMHYLKNSVITTAGILVAQLMTVVPAAYAFAKRKFPLSGIAFGVVLVAFMIPQQLTYIPVYLMMAKAKLISSLWPQILPLGADAFGIFMLRQSFKQIPDEIVESAKLDGAGEIKVMLRIMLPMCKSAMVTIAMFSFIGTWNSYFWPLVMTNNDAYRPLTLAIERLRDAEVGIHWNTLMAGNCLLVVPILVVFIFASRKIIEGFAYRGVK